MAEAMENKLREFVDTDDLFDSASSEKILEWVNAHAKQVGGRLGYQKKYQARKRLLLKHAAKLFDKDELERIEALAEEEANEKH